MSTPLHEKKSHFMGKQYIAIHFTCEGIPNVCDEIYRYGKCRYYKACIAAERQLPLTSASDISLGKVLHSHSILKFVCHLTIVYELTETTCICNHIQKHRSSLVIKNFYRQHNLLCSLKYYTLCTI